jgi:hypothetical protein
VCVGYVVHINGIGKLNVLFFVLFCFFCNKKKLMMIYFISFFFKKKQKGEQGLYLPSVSIRRARAIPPDVGPMWPLSDIVPGTRDSGYY